MDSVDEPLDAVARVKQARKAADDGGQAEWRDESADWYDFAAGKQWSEDEKAALNAQFRAPVTFNRIGPMVDSVAGSEVNNRQQVQYIPRQIGDKGLNEVLTGAADYIRDNCEAEDEESDAFLDSVICGIGCTETRLDYETDPEGTVLIERRDPLQMRWDPGAKKRNLMDRRWQQYDAWLPRDVIMAKWPEAELAPIGDGIESDEPIPSSKNGRSYERDRTGYDKRNGTLRVTHHQWFEAEDYYQVLDPATQQIVDMSVEDHERMQARAKTVDAATGLPLMGEIQSVKKSRRVYMQAFVCGGTVLEEGKVPCNRFTFHFITGKRDRNRNTWYGIVKPMIDPQKWANKFFSQILHIINTNAKGGLMMEADAVENLEKFKAEWAKAESVSIVEPGAISGGKIQAKTPPLIPAELSNMLQFSISSMRDVTGINLELLGMTDRQQAGIVEAQRKQAAMTVLASLFDGLRRYRKEQGRTLAAFIVDYMSDGRLVRIVGGDGTERYVPLVRDPQAMEYDVVVDEAPASVNQKERTFALLTQMLPNLANMGVPFAVELLEYSPLPTAMVEKWKQILAQQQGNPQQMQQQMQQMQQAIQQLQGQLQQAQEQLRSKDQEIAAKMQAAQMSSDADLTATLQKARMQARADYASTIEKARLDAEAAIQKAIIDANARVTIAQATQPQQPTILQVPEQRTAPEVVSAMGNIEQLMQAVSRIAEAQQAMHSAIASASRKPSRFQHDRDPETGFITQSRPIFE